MKFTLSWLKDHLETDASLDHILLSLTDLGLEVEEVLDPMDKLKHFTIGEVLEAEQHPDADRLKVCKVLTGQGIKQIICGAPNARAGIKVVVAQPGDYIPGIDTTIKVGKIRGIESVGMMCSERELMLSDEHDGIIELGAHATIGQRYIDFCDNLEITINIAITPNRPDALGVRGIARDLSARGVGQLKDKEIPKIPGTFKSPVSVYIEKDVIEQDCPLFVGRYIRGVKNVQSPKWLQERLIAIGLRPISALVDITNFVTYDYGRPLHVFDADKLKTELTVRKAKFNEKVTALDGVEYELSVDDTVISSGNLVESIAGVIGGMNSGCSSNTKDVFVESAYFNPISTAKTGRRTKINSDARYRFERGVDPKFTEPGIELATKLIIEFCGGEVSEVVIEGRMPSIETIITLRPSRVDSLIGMKISRAEQIKILKALGFIVFDKNDDIIAEVPSWRPDVFGEADLIEEIVRVRSLSKLKGVPLKAIKNGVSKPILTPLQKRLSVLRRQIATLGMNECISYSFIDKRSSELFSRNGSNTILTNPISSEMSHMRPSLLPGLFQAASRNQSRSYNDLKFFEIGEVFFGNQPGEQNTHASGIFIGNYFPKNSYNSQRSVDVFDAKKVIELVLSQMSISTEKLTLIRANTANYFHPGRSAILTLGPKNPLATFGELHPKISSFYDLKGSAVAFEIFVDNIPFPRQRKVTRGPLKLSDFQPVERDFAFVVERNCEVESIRKAILSSEKNLITEARVFDIFEGREAEKQLGENRKSVAVTVRLQPLDSTFTDNEIEIISERIIRNVEQDSGGTLRT